MAARAPSGRASRASWRVAACRGGVRERAQRWRCSWLYLQRACQAAEALLPPARQPEGAGAAGRAGSCLGVLPPNGPGLLGWLEADPAHLNESAITGLLFGWRCW